MDAVPSRSTITNDVWRAAVSISSMIVFSEMSEMTARFSGRPSLAAHCETGLLGSASMTVTEAPLRASSVASRTAEVDFPAPPLGLAKTMVGMEKLLRSGVKLEDQEVTEGY